MRDKISVKQSLDRTLHGACTKMILLQKLLRHQRRGFSFQSDSREYLLLFGCQLVYQRLIGKAMLGKNAINRKSIPAKDSLL
nr:hypothetical protein [uncultured Prevotella sp.]